MGGKSNNSSPRPLTCEGIGLISENSDGEVDGSHQV